METTNKPAKRDAAYYRGIGRAAYEAGIVVMHGAPRSWQHAARIAGYKAARAQWQGANPGADEWAAMAEKNRAFCASALAYPSRIFNR